MRKTAILLVLIIFSCKQHKFLKKNINSNIDSITISINKKDSLLTAEKKLKLFLANTEEVKVIAFNKGMIETSIPDSSICKKWILKREDVIQIIKKNRPISRKELHYLFDMNTCVYNGKIRYKNKNYNFTINSGGFIYLKYNDILLGCFTGDCTKYFLSTGEDY
ncbi:MAG: hypothetical protein L3J23_01535 [Flavobacteriaceae bacterium]|nr:hypothetical protein [Flavobacteriaceae bacterium]